MLKNISAGSVTKLCLTRKCNLINLPSAVAGVDGKTGRTAAYTKICAVWKKRFLKVTTFFYLQECQESVLNNKKSAPRFLIQSLRRCTSEWILISHFLYSNRSRTPPTSTSPTCPCLWMSKSWRACSSLLARSFPPASSEMLMGPAVASDLPGQTVASHGGPSCLEHIFCYQLRVICAALARTNRMQTALLERD